MVISAESPLQESEETEGMTSRQTTIVVCEGDSERNYIAAINRLLCRAEGTMAFRAWPAGSGHFSRVRQAYEDAQRKNRRQEIVIWVDEDLYVRNERGCRDMLQAWKGSAFRFSRMNFEDFLFLHRPDLLGQWLQFCSERHHFSAPMVSEEYMVGVKKLLPEYEKGDLPFDITPDALRAMFANLKDQTIPIRNDFGELLLAEVERGTLKFIV